MANLTLEEGRGGQEENVGGATVWTKRGQMAFEALMRMLDNKVLPTVLRILFYLIETCAQLSVVVIKAHKLPHNYWAISSAA